MYFADRVASYNHTLPYSTAIILKALHEYPPLTIKHALDAEELRSYKAAWDKQTATVSFESTGRHEDH